MSLGTKPDSIWPQHVMLDPSRERRWRRVEPLTIRPLFRKSIVSRSLCTKTFGALNPPQSMSKMAYRAKSHKMSEVSYHQKLQNMFPPLPGSFPIESEPTQAASYVSRKRTSFFDLPMNFVKTSTCTVWEHLSKISSFDPLVAQVNLSLPDQSGISAISALAYGHARKCTTRPHACYMGNTHSTLATISMPIRASVWTQRSTVPCARQQNHNLPQIGLAAPCPH